MWKRALFILPLLVGLGLFAFIILRFGGLEGTLQGISEVGRLGLAAFLANGTLTLIVPAVAWWLLMRGEGLKVTVWTAIKANLMGFPLNFITPSLYLGAEPLKLFYVAHEHGESKRRILATIVVSKFQEFGGILIMTLVAGVIAVWRLDLTPRQETVLVVTLAVLAILFGLVLYAFIRNHKPTVILIDLVARLGLFRSRLERLRGHAVDLEELMHLAFTKRWRTFLTAQAIMQLSALSVFIRPWLFTWFASDGKMMESEYMAGIYVITNITTALTITPGGLGLFEGGLIFFASTLGFTDEQMAGYSVLIRTTDLFLILLGIWLIVHYGMQAVARRVAKGEEHTSLHEAKEGEMEGIRSEGNPGP